MPVIKVHAAAAGAFYLAVSMKAGAETAIETANADHGKILQRITVNHRRNLTNNNLLIIIT